MLTHEIILASQSPRRKQLLEQSGFTVTVKSLPVEETYPADLAVEKVPIFLAQKKANASASLLENDSQILLAADSVVIQQDEIFGKPKDYDDAVRILRTLSGKPHHVVTGVCLKSKAKEVAFSGLSTVHMDHLSEEEIEYYVKTCKPYDKAGSYAIQEWIGMCKVSRIEGTYSNIMGLPMHKVYQELMDF